MKLCLVLIRGEMLGLVVMQIGVRSCGPAVTQVVFASRSSLLRALMAVKEGSSARAPSRWAGTVDCSRGAQIAVGISGKFSKFEKK